MPHVVMSGIRIGLVVLAGLAFGFLDFWLHIPAPVATPPKAEAMVVFTGGSKRVSTGGKLLEEGFNGPVLISGVYPGLSVDQIVFESPLPENLKAHIDLDYAARTTAGNVRETLNWAEQKGVHSIILVTSWYHMPRSLALFHELGSTVAVHAYPVTPAEPVSWRLIALEFCKYLAVRVGVVGT